MKDLIHIFYKKSFIFFEYHIFKFAIIRKNERIVVVKKLIIIIESILLCLSFSITVFAKTETVDISSNKVNLINLANQLHEKYSYDENTYYFSFNGNTFEIEKNNSLFKVNNKLTPISTEVKNKITVPVYKTFQISDNTVEMSKERFVNLTKYDVKDNKIEVTLDDDYVKPEVKTIDNLDFDYIKNHLTDFGYVLEDGMYKYYINNEVYQEITVGTNSLSINTKIGEKYEENKTIQNLLIEEIFRAFDSTNYRDIYNSYLNEENEKETDLIKVDMLFTETYSQITIQVK